MKYAEIEKQLIKHEGLRLKPYKCPAGRLTLGIGRNLDDKGITEKEALYLLKNDIVECMNDLDIIFLDQFNTWPDNIQMALIDMRFQLGGKGFRKFKRMIISLVTGWNTKNTTEIFPFWQN